MADTYFIRHANPALPGIAIQPGVVDGPGYQHRSTDLYLPGSGKLKYGEMYNSNFLKMLEHFAHPEVFPGVPSPLVLGAPVVGQLWFNTTTNQLYAYNGQVWAALVSNNTTVGLDQATADSRYLRLTGGILTGALTLPVVEIAQNGKISFNGDGGIYEYAPDAYRFAVGTSTSGVLSIGEQSVRSNPDTFVSRISLRADGRIEATGLITASGGVVVQNVFNASGLILQGVGNPQGATDAANKLYVDNAIAGVIAGSNTGVTLDVADARYVNVSGDTMAGPLALGNNRITALGDPVGAQDAVTKSYVDLLTSNSGGLTQTAADGRYLQLSGGSLTGNVTSSGNFTANNITGSSQLISPSVRLGSAVTLNGSSGTDVLTVVGQSTPGFTKIRFGSSGDYIGSLSNGTLQATRSNGSLIFQVDASSNLTTGAIRIARDGTSSDPYAPIGVTRGTSSSYAYYSMTRAGAVAWQTGIDTSNSYSIGYGGTNGPDGVMGGAKLAIGLDGRIFINNDIFMTNSASFGGGNQTSGYSRLLNGLILQWGWVFINAFAENRSPYNVPYNIAFPNACFSIVTTIWNNEGNPADDVWTQIINTNNASFNIIANEIDSGNNDVEGFTYFAIGH